jgi:gliding motility-associated-like protein
MPPGPYVARVTDFNGCQDSVALVIGDTPPAVPAFVTDPDAGQPVLLSQAEIQFINQSSGAVAYRWDFGDGRGLSDAVNPVYTYADTGTYEILLTAWNAFFACPTEYRVQVRVIFDGAIYVPNAFTPNGDGQNEAFLVKGEGVVWMELLLFDRWGRLITRFDSLDSRWDGSGPGGGPAPEGVYTYVLRARLNSGRELERGGTVTLIR